MALLGSGEVDTGLQGGEHSGEMDCVFLRPPVSADLGWSLSGLRALLSNGEPGSVDLGREKDFLLGVRLVTLALPGEKVWVAFDDPGW